MGKVVVLDTHVANMIAAGEVVERPASVVKELLENAIDAGAKQIDLYIERGGTKRIKVTDNGVGMSKEDIVTAFKRHATSKITTEADLFNITTLGFRGEALPSIASVSKVSLTSKSVGSVTGTRVIVQGGQTMSSEVVGAPQGTTVVVEDLFFNTPARKKFMKSPRSESMRINEIFKNIALSNPSVAFRFYKEDRLVSSTNGDNKVLETIVEFFGAEYGNNIIPINYRQGDYEVVGFVGTAALTRHNRQHQYFFVNGRTIDCPTINHALEAVFRSYIPSKRFPVCFLFFKIPPSDLDVNVHPAKTEVRFINGRNIHGLVTRAVSECVKSSESEEAVIFTNSESITESSAGYSVESKGLSPTPRNNIKMVTKANKDGMQKSYYQDYTVTAIDKATIEKDAQRDLSVSHLNQIMLLGQIHNSYIVVQSREGIVIIDQHAAHERILYQMLLNIEHEREKAVQHMVIPIELHFTRFTAEIIANNLGVLKSLGVLIEEFGSNSFIVRGLPSFIANNIKENELKAMLEDCSNETGKHKPMQLRQQMLIEFSCKGAIKANQALSRNEMIDLIKALSTCSNWLRCPHGRPTIWQISKSELDKKFLRI